MIDTYLKEEITNGVKVYRTYTKIENLKPDPQNPRDITDDKKADLKEFLQKYGDFKPILMDVRPDHEGQLIGGNKRLEAKLEMGATEAWVEPRMPESDAQAFEMGTIDNMEFGHYVEARLLQALKQYEGQIDISKLGVGLAPIPTFEQLMKDFKKDTKEDEPPEVSTEPAISKTGEVYQLGRHRLMCGDATVSADVETLMNGQKADMLFTDPPYNVDYEGKTEDALKIENDKFKTNDEFYNFLLAAFTNMRSVSKSGAPIYVCHADSEGYNFRHAFQEAGYALKQCIIWNKNSMVMGRQDYQWKHEPILYGWLEGAAHSYYGDRRQTTVWDIERPTKSTERPTMKPIALIANALRNSSKGDDVVVDLFGGSGSTLIACEQMGRTCYTMELDPKYVDVIRKRYAKFVDHENEWETITPCLSAIPDIAPVDTGTTVPTDQSQTGA